jgi:hypothetical protein
MKTVVSLAGAVLLALLTGCSSDQLQVIDYTDQVGPGETVTVNLVEMFVHANTSSEFPEPVARDSLFFAVGLPAGWTPVGVSHYVADHITMAGLGNDTAAAQEALQDSMAVFLQRLSPMASWSSAATFMSGKQLSLASNPLDSTATVVSADDIDNWNGYSAKIELSITEPDTVISVRDAGEMVDSVDTTYYQYVDSIATAMVPILIQVQCIAGSRTGPQTLYFYAKSGELPEDMGPATQDDMLLYLTSKQLGLPADDPFDIGGTVAAQVQVGITGIDPSPVRPQTIESSSPLSVRMEGGRVVHIICRQNTASAPGIAIYSPMGEVIRTLQPRPTTHSYRARWDGTNNFGAPVPQGIYLLKVADGSSSHARSLHLLRP